MAKIPLHPKNPDRICWGCDKFCPAESLACGNGTIRTQHPIELFGEDWLEWAEQRDSHMRDSAPGDGAACSKSHRAESTSDKLPATRSLNPAHPST